MSGMTEATMEANAALVLHYFLRFLDGGSDVMAAYKKCVDAFSGSMLEQYVCNIYLHGIIVVP